MVVVGGAGTFGQHLAQGLLARTGCIVVIAGRDLRRAEAAAAALAARHGPGRVRAARLDGRSASAEALRAIGAFAVADAAGPFQDGSHALARAAIGAGAHYVDLADARAYVAGFAAALDAEARAAGVVARTGASSTPALSNAALDALTRGWQAIGTVEVGISPGNRAPRGRSVMRAILSWVGQPVRVWLDGRWESRRGWGLTARWHIAGLGPRWLSLAETPDLDILPCRFAVGRSAVFRAGLELPVLHWGLGVAGLAVRCGLLRSLAPAAGAFRALAMLFRPFGTDRGGMVVEARGRDAAGRPVRATWTLVAEGGDGPVVPTLPALALLRALLAGAGSPEPGARACAGEPGLAAIEAEFAPYRITTQQAVVPDPLPAAPLFARALGAEAFAALPRPLRAAHAPGGHWHALAGEAVVEGAAGGMPARLIAALFRLPRPGRAIPVRVTMEATPGGGERWVRDFAGRRFATTLRLHPAGGLLERFGPFRVRLELRGDAQGLEMVIRGWSLGPLPLPARLAPAARAREDTDADGRFRFDVELTLPGLGRLVRYRGWLVPEGRDRPAAAAT